MLIAYTAATYGLLSESHKATKAAVRSSSVDAKQLELSQRAWIATDPTTFGTIDFDAPDIEVPITIHLENVGHSVALDILPVATIIFGGSDQIVEAAQTHCETMRHGPRPPGLQDGIILFPGQATDVRVLAHPSDPAMVRLLKTPGTTSTGRIQVMTCVTYKFSFDGAFHQTRRVYTAARVLPAGLPDVIFELHGRVGGLSFLDNMGVSNVVD